MRMKTAIVTGASGNMGQAVVRKMIEQGYKVIGTAVPNDTTPMYFPTASFEKIVVDLTNENAAQKFVQQVLNKYGSVDVAILTVGGFAMGNIAETKSSDISKQYKLNFETAYNVAQPCFTAMIKQNSGRIFLIGSRPGLDPKAGTGMVAYVLAKSLIFRLAELMNAEAKGKNVVTSVVVPSTLDTELNRKSMPDADYSTWVKPSAIADIIYFYCSDAGAALREPVIRIYNNS
jgi:NAD(P)-dependent dehydrogenase (short-subunit alcohol dehydrogenase family)